MSTLLMFVVLKYHTCSIVYRMNETAVILVYTMSKGLEVVSF